MKTGVSYFGNRSIKHVAEDMKDIASSYCTFVVHTFSENDFQYYKETMRNIVKISHEHGLEVYLDPWGIGGVFGGEAYSALVARDLSIRQIRNDGESVPCACLNQPRFREFLKEWAQTAVSFGADYIFWDEPHFYIPGWFGEKGGTGWTCYCPVCKEKFYQRYKQDIPKDKLTPELKEFREESILDFLQDMSDAVVSYGAKNAVCMLPSDETSRWEKIAAIKSLSVIGTDPYWIGPKKDVKEFVSHYSKEINRIATKYNKEGQIWVQAFKIPSGREEEVGIAIDTAIKCGIRNIAVWGYEGCAVMSHLSCDNPELVWKIIVNQFAAAHTYSPKN